MDILSPKYTLATYEGPERHKWLYQDEFKCTEESRQLDLEFWKLLLEGSVVDKTSKYGHTIQLSVICPMIYVSNYPALKCDAIRNRLIIVKADKRNIS